MKSTIVLATMPLSNANGAIDNLVEADFNESDISVIAENEPDARNLINDGGPLKGVSSKTLLATLKAMHIPQAEKLAAQVKSSTVLIAVNANASTQTAIEETLHDAGGSVWG